jgi:hypothetical protein
VKLAGLPGAAAAASNSLSEKPDRGERSARAGVPLDRVRTPRPWLFGLLAVAVVLRAAVMVAYYPALEFHGDSYSYLGDAARLHPGLWHPLAYPVFLRVLSFAHLLVVVPLVQHLLGLATGLLIYRLLERHGVGDFGAALAAAPILLDAYQLDVEQMVMSEALFDFLLFAGVYLLLDPRSSLRRQLLGGGLIGLATLTRTFALPCAAVLVLVLLLRRVGVRRIAAVALATAAPLGGYALLYHHEYGRLGLNSYNGRALYGGVAVFADCDKLPSATDRLLCPPVPKDQRGASSDYTWSTNSPLQRLTLLRAGQPAPADPAAARRVAAQNSISDDAAAGRFSRHVIVRQPWDYARSAAGIAGHFFAPYRYFGVRDFADVPWQFPARVNPPPPWNHEVAHAGFNGKPVQPHLVHPLAAALRGYQRVVYTPGSVLLLGLAIGCWGVARRRRDPRALVTGALLGCGVMVLVMPAIGLQYEHRYALPAQLFLPAAGVLGWRLATEQRSSGRVPLWQRRTAFAGVALLGLSVNAATGGLVSADRQRPATIAPIGTMQHLPHAPLEVGIAPPTFVHSHCVKDLGRYRLVWNANFPVLIRATGAGPLLAQGANVSVVGDHNSPYIRPFASREAIGMPDVLLLRAGQQNAGLVQFQLKSRTGVVLYNDVSGGGVVGWRYSMPVPKRIGLPGTACTPAHGVPPRG